MKKCLSYGKNMFSKEKILLFIFSLNIMQSLWADFGPYIEYEVSLKEKKKWGVYQYWKSNDQQGNYFSQIDDPEGKFNLVWCKVIGSIFVEIVVMHAPAEVIYAQKQSEKIGQFIMCPCAPLMFQEDIYSGSFDGHTQTYTTPGGQTIPFMDTSGDKMGNLYTPYKGRYSYFNNTFLQFDSQIMNSDYELRKLLTYCVLGDKLKKDTVNKEVSFIFENNFDPTIYFGDSGKESQQVNFKLYLNFQNDDPVVNDTVYW